jgi:hypothetical protein
MPRQLVLANGWRAFVLVALPGAVYATVEFDLPAYGGLIVFAGALVAVGYAAILHFFSSEMFVRPVLEDIARHLPPDFGGARLGVPLRWKLLGALPLINVITGVVARGLSTDGSASLDDLGLSRRPARGDRGRQAGATWTRACRWSRATSSARSPGRSTR